MLFAKNINQRYINFKNTRKILNILIKCIAHHCISVILEIESDYYNINCKEEWKNIYQVICTRKLKKKIINRKKFHKWLFYLILFYLLSISHCFLQWKLTWKTKLAAKLFFERLYTAYWDLIIKLTGMYST